MSSIIDRALIRHATGGLLAGTTSAFITFTDAASIDADSVLVKNSGSAVAFFASGSAATVPANGAVPLPNQMPLLPGEIDLLYKGKGVATVAFITASGTSQVYATACRGD